MWKCRALLNHLARTPCVPSAYALFYGWKQRELSDLHGGTWDRFRRVLQGPYPGMAGTFRKNSGKTPETLSERLLEFPSKVRPGSPKPYDSRQLRLPEHFQNSLPLSMAGDAFSSEVVLERASQSWSWNSQQY